jgi:hypothetical protein
MTSVATITALGMLSPAEAVNVCEDRSGMSAASEAASSVPVLARIEPSGRITYEWPVVEA